jgi:phosphoenolpyruvate synthase/pyruvate phosphate dikinase
MLRKKIIVALSMLSACLTQCSVASHSPAKVLQLSQLQTLVENINLQKPIGNYLFAVPPFAEITTQDISQFLAGIPSGKAEQKGRKQRQLSMLEYINILWTAILEQHKMHKKITPAMREYLIELRAAIETAFQHDVLNGKINPQLRAFLQRQIEQKNILIVRPAPKEPLFAVKSTCNVHANDISKAIAQTLVSFFSEEAIQERMTLGILAQRFDLGLILQVMITEDEPSKQYIVSGISSSFDTFSNMRAPLVSISSIFGDIRALEASHMPHDSYYVSKNMVYPVIRKKPNRYVPDTCLHARLVPNPASLEQAVSLSKQAVLEITRATRTLEEIYDMPICLSFIKRDHTIYILKVHAPDIDVANGPTFFDTLYTDSLSQDRMLPIQAIKPSHNLTIIKKRSEIILAPNIRTCIHLLNNRKESKDVRIAVIKDLPAKHTKEAQLLESLQIPVMWSSDFEQLRTWLDEKKYPLIFDPQQKIVFQFSRCRGFCTLFQGVRKGLCAHPVASQLSLLPEFIAPLNDSEKAELKSDEHFPGVPLKQLFDILKFGTFVMAESAIHTLLYRLQKAIAYEHIVKKECAVSSQPFDSDRCDRMEQLYAYIERIAFQLHTLFKQLKGTTLKHADEFERMFLVNMLQATILQEADEQIVHAASFAQVHQAGPTKVK